eukprot:7382003-Prymnesium_polylepis.1
MGGLLAVSMPPAARSARSVQPSPNADVLVHDLAREALGGHGSDVGWKRGTLECTYSSPPPDASRPPSPWLGPGAPGGRAPRGSHRSPAADRTI